MGIEFHRDPDFVEQRRVRRQSAPLDISVRERSRSAAPARMVDFNANGCRIAGNSLLLAGNHLWVKIPGLESLGTTIAWCDGDQAGVVFEHPLHHSVAERYFPQPSAPLAIVTSPDHPLPRPANDELLSRRETIMQGIVAADTSPLKTKKQSAGGRIADMIVRRVPRESDQRREERFADAISTAPMVLKLDGRDAGIDNVSCSGLKVQAELDDDIGSRIAVEFAGFPPMAGTLIWRSDRAAGISLPRDSIALDAGMQPE